jgi:hypothetical protein
MRRFTIACGLPTMATLFVLTWHGQSLSGSRPARAAEVTVIPDQPMFWPPVKPLPAPPLKALPPVPYPKPLGGAQHPHSTHTKGL